MGESLVGRPKEKTMDESVKSSGGLEVSVSFGKFENDVLCWEKWSSFSPNKYLEEVGSLSTPGSVAQKKAYFEAHYKKIAAMKAEHLEQQNSMNPTSPSLDESRNDTCIKNSCGIEAEFSLSSGERLSKETVIEEYESPLIDASLCNEAVDDCFDCNKESKKESTTNGFVGGIGGEECASSIRVECGSYLVEEVKDELNGNNVVGLESTPVKVEIRGKDSHQTKERKHGTKQTTPKMNVRGVAQKVTSTKRDTTTSRIHKKTVSPPTNPLPTPIPKHSTKKVNGLSKSKNFEPGGSKRAMSLNLAQANSLTSQCITRKSRTMEKMEDRDIIRPAVKNFQNRANASLSGEKKVASTASEAKISTSLPREKGIKGSSRSSVVDNRKTVAISPTISLKSDDRAEKRREFVKNLEAKSIARAAEKAQISARTKEEKEFEIKKLRKSLNFKAKPLPSFYKSSS